MKSKILFLLTIASLLLFGLTANTQENKDAKQKKAVVTFVVNMSCDNCKNRIEKNISWEKGVKDLRVDLESKTVKIVYDTRKTTEEDLRKAIEKLGYTCEKLE
ncbi:hypothetical protein FACS189413_00300 [Bacteroidia bacterium]|nr:hypothetical protein FACS189413_00300 [Bacteroidia bacterium]